MYVQLAPGLQKFRFWSRLGSSVPRVKVYNRHNIGCSRVKLHSLCGGLVSASSFGLGWGSQFLGSIRTVIGGEMAPPVDLVLSRLSCCTTQ